MFHFGIAHSFIFTKNTDSLCSEGLAAFNILQERNIPSRFLTFPDENHWVLNEENSLIWHTVVLNWINKYADLPPYKEDRDLPFEVQSPAGKKL